MLFSCWLVIWGSIKCINKLNTYIVAGLLFEHKYITYLHFNLMQNPAIAEKR